MAKDGTNRGGRRVRAGGKPEALADKIQQGKDATIMKVPVSDFEGTELDPGEDLEGVDMPDPSAYLSVLQRDGKPLGADVIYKETWIWLRERGCEKLVNKRLIESYSEAFARYVQCSEAVSTYGMLGKHPTTKMAIASPYVQMGLSFQKQANLLWYEIYDIVKDHGTECYFEKENIWTFDSKGELLLTIMSSLAQEESRSISENVTWGHRKRFADGKVSVPFSNFLGYDRGPDGNLVINEEQAEIVRDIYGLFLDGLSYNAIAREMEKKGYKTARGKETWTGRGVLGILTNEKYKGDALLQKCFTVSYLTKKQKKNEGEVPQYYVENNHEAIIPREKFDLAQAEVERRRNLKGRYSGVSIFSTHIKCGDCGNWYGSKVWHSTDKYKKTVWNCNGKTTKKCGCKTPKIEEEQIKGWFIQALNSFTEDRAEVIENVQTELERLTDVQELDDKIRELSAELNVVADMMNEMIAENARVAQDQTEYQERYEGLNQRYLKIEAEADAAKAKKRLQGARRKDLERFVKTLQKLPDEVTTFSSGQWGALVDFMTVYSDGKVVFTFKNGMEIPIE